MILGSICLLTLVLALAYASVTPYRKAGVLMGPMHGVPVDDIGAPDERQHVNYVSHLLDGRGIPVMGEDPSAPQEGIEYHQPPLFYLLDAGWAKLTGAGDGQDADTGMRLRWLDALLAVATVLGVFFGAKWTLDDDSIALCAAAIAGLLPMSLALGGAVSNDPLLIALCTWFLALCAQGVVRGWTIRLALLAGGIAGLALLTKTTALALLPCFALACALAPGKAAERFRALLAGGGVAVLLALPWWLRNQAHYGDPLAMKIFAESFTHTAQAKDFIAHYGAGDYWLNWVGWWTARSFVGVFGYMDIFLPDSLYRFALALIILALLLATLGLPAEAPRRRSLAVMLCLTGFVVAQFLYFNATYFQAQGRYLYPAIGPIAIFMSLGLARLLGPRAKLAPLAIAVLLIALNVYILLRLPGDFQARTLG